jgi:hypothetical protein
MPWCLWLGFLGWAVLERALPGAGAPAGEAPALLRAAFLSSAAFSVVLAFCQSCDLHGLLQYWSPATFSRIARVFDVPTAFAERLANFRGGPIEMDIAFARHSTQSYEPLVVTGVEYQKDYVYLYYQSDTVVRFCCTSLGRNLASADVAVEPGRTYHLRIECASLYPPEGHPFYDGWSQMEVHSAKSWVRIELDGRSVLDGRMSQNEASPGTIQIGSDSGYGVFGKRFTGTIARVRRGPWRRPSVEVEGTGDFELQFNLSGEAPSENQPLLVAGRTAKADLLGIRTVDEAHFALLYESWGSGLWESGPVAFDDSRSVSLRVRFGPLLQVDGNTPLAILRRSLVVWKGATPVWWFRTVRPPDPNPELSTFDNSIGSSGMLPEFQGLIRSVARDPEPWEWRPGPFAALEMDLAGRGTAEEPLVATGRAGRGDALAVRWLPGGRAQILYDHSGVLLRESEVFAWPAGRMLRLRAELPALPALDSKGAAGSGEGRMRILLDGKRVWEERVPYFAAPSASVAVGRSPAGFAGSTRDLTCVVADLRQAAR